MIICSKCKKEMRNVYRYEGKEGTLMNVWHCCDCDFTIALHESITVITWCDKKLNGLPVGIIE